MADTETHDDIPLAMETKERRKRKVGEIKSSEAEVTPDQLEGAETIHIVESDHHGDSQDGQEEHKKSRSDQQTDFQFGFGGVTSEKGSHNGSEMSAATFLGLDTAVASGSVPDMSTVASSIASLSSQPPPPGWSFMVSGSPTTPEKGMSNLQQQQQQQLYNQLLLQHQAWYLQNMQNMQHGVDTDSGNSALQRYPLGDRGSLSEATGMFTDSSPGLFMLIEQPNEVQRKSYKNENRCILPNPLSICPREYSGDEMKRPQIMDAAVTVQLVDQEGQELAPNKASILDSVEKGMTQGLDENLTAQFSLKIMETSEGNMYRLLFTVTYRLKSVGNCEEKILSRPFIVYSNRKKSLGKDAKDVRARVNNPESPIVIDLKPDHGECNHETEVWIKGRSFNDKVMVMFGDKQAKVIDIAENLISVIAPAQDDLMQDTAFPVYVANKYGREHYPADKKPTFTYLVSK